MSRATADIREAVHDGPSTRAWQRLVRAFDQLSNEEVGPMLALAEPRVEAWPEKLRVAPPAWWARVEQGADVPGWVLIRALELDDGGPEVGEQLARTPASRQIAHLRLAGVRLQDGGAEALADAERLVQLKSVAILDADLLETGLLAIARARWPRLEALDLSGNEVSPEALARLLSSHGRGDLRLSRCGLGAAGLRCLAESPATASLWSIDVADNDAGDSGVAALVASGYLHRLSRLRLSNNRLADRSAVAVGASRELEALDALDLAGNGIGPVGVRALVGSGRLGSLGDLSLSGNPIGPEGAEALTDRYAPELYALALSDARLDPRAIGMLVTSDKASRLTALDLSRNETSMSAVAAIAGSKALAAVRHLDLSGCGIGDDGLALLARSRTLDGLLSLGLAEDGITPNGLAASLQSLRLRRLAEIDLSDNPLGDAGARCLAESGVLSRLQRIRAVGCGFSEDAVGELLASAPQLQVET